MNGHVSDEQLSLLIDNELSLTARQAVTSHIETCPTCAERHDALVDVAAALRLAPSATWPAERTRTLLAALEEPRSSREPALWIATALAAGGLTIAVLEEHPTRAGITLAQNLLGVASGFAPGGLGPVSITLLVMLVGTFAATLRRPRHRRWR